MNKPIISIIIPVYNTEKYLKKCLSSVLNQSIIDKIEVLIIDDGSTDNSYSLALEYASKNPNFFAFKQSNSGQSKARNFGLLKASGKYVGFVDSDDYISKYMFETLLYFIELTESSVADIQPTKNSNYLSNISNVKNLSYQILERGEILEQFLKDGLSKSLGQYTVWRKLYRREIIGDIKFLDKRIYEDMEFNFRVLKKSLKLVKINSILYFYNLYNTSTTRNALKIRDFDLIYICKKIVNYSKADNILSKLSKEKLTRSYFSLIMKYIKFGRHQSVKTVNILGLYKNFRTNFKTFVTSQIPINRKILGFIILIIFPLVFKVKEFIK